MVASINRSRLGTPGRYSADSIASRVRLVLNGIVERVLEWHERSAQRHRLMGLDDRMLRDIGLTRSDVVREFMKAPWRV